MDATIGAPKHVHKLLTNIRKMEECQYMNTSAL
jgi:hypothetical protein